MKNCYFDFAYQPNIYCNIFLQTQKKRREKKKRKRKEKKRLLVNLISYLHRQKPTICLYATAIMVLSAADTDYEAPLLHEQEEEPFVKRTGFFFFFSLFVLVERLVGGLVLFLMLCESNCVCADDG